MRHDKYELIRIVNTHSVDILVINISLVLLHGQVKLDLKLNNLQFIRYRLKKANFIKNGPTFEETKCEKNITDANCYTCSATHICAKQVKTNIISY